MSTKLTPKRQNAKNIIICSHTPGGILRYVSIFLKNEKTTARRKIGEVAKLRYVSTKITANKKAPQRVLDSAKLRLFRKTY